MPNLPTYTHLELVLRTFEDGDLPAFPEYPEPADAQFIDVSAAVGVRVYWQIAGALGGAPILRVRRWLRARDVAFDETLRDLSTLAAHGDYQTAPVAPYADALATAAGAAAGNVFVEGLGTSWMTIQLAELNPGVTAATARLTAVVETRAKWQ